jgi:bifunctional enzyme Fae/Hps
MLLNRRQKYLQIALNRSIHEIGGIINQLPASPFIIMEAGTTFIKKYGRHGIAEINNLWSSRLGQAAYVVADLKCMDRGLTEVSMAVEAGAKAATCLGLAPIETINEFIKYCKELGIDSMLDMMNIEFPFEILQQLKVLPDVVVLHRGVDEVQNKAKIIPYHNINRIKGAYNIMISVAGGETFKDVNRSYFNGVDIAVIWRSFFDDPKNSKVLAENFLSTIKAYGKR